MFTKIEAGKKGHCTTRKGHVEPACSCIDCFLDSQETKCITSDADPLPPVIAKNSRGNTYIAPPQIAKRACAPRNRSAFFASRCQSAWLDAFLINLPVWQQQHGVRGRKKYSKSGNKTHICRIEKVRHDHGSTALRACAASDC